LSDFFSPSRLRWATAIFSMGITLGSGLSYKIGGWAYEVLATIDFSSWPLLADMAPWQLTFVAVGLPGFIVVALLFFMIEPPRQTGSIEREEPLALAAVVAYMRRHWQAYGALVTGVCMMSIIGYGTLTWFAEFLMRSYAMSRADAGDALGNIFLVAGTAGSFAGAAFATWLQKRGHQDANMRTLMLAAAVLIVPATAAPLMPSSEAAIALAWVVIFIHYSHFGVSMAALQLITPGRMRAQASALMLFMTNLFGLALGGSFVAFFTDFIFADDQALRYSLAWVAAIVYPIAAVVTAAGLRYYRRALLH
jgi:MFS family permease